MPVTVEDRVRNTPSQPKTEFRRLDFLAVFLAHGSNESEKVPARLQEVHMAEEFHPGDGKQSQGRVSKGSVSGPETAPDIQVVDGEDGGDVAEGRVFGNGLRSRTGMSADCQSWQMENLGHAENLRTSSTARENRANAQHVGIVAGRST